MLWHPAAVKQCLSGPHAKISMRKKETDQSSKGIWSWLWVELCFCCYATEAEIICSPSGAPAGMSWCSHAHCWFSDRLEQQPLPERGVEILGSEPRLVVWLPPRTKPPRPEQKLVRLRDVPSVEEGHALWCQLTISELSIATTARVLPLNLHTWGPSPSNSIEDISRRVNSW